MDFLSEIFQEIITEEARVVDVVDAIKKRYEAKITYKADNDPKGTGSRIIQPVAYGTTKAGNPVIRAFEPYGDTKTKTPAWKFFRLDRITSWKPLRQNKFSEPPEDQWLKAGTDGKFNEAGDNSMAEVFLIADFKNTKARYERGGLAKYNAARTAQRKKENPLSDFEKNVEKGKQIGNIDQIQKNITDWERQQKEKQERQQHKDAINNKGNQSSISDMKNAQNFPDDTVQTVGPIRKSNTDIANTDKKDLDYTNAKQAGPKYKNGETNYEKEKTAVGSNNNDENEKEER